MTEPEKDQTEKDQTETEAETRAHAGPHDEGGAGGMATRELAAHEAAESED